MMTNRVSEEKPTEPSQSAGRNSALMRQLNSALGSLSANQGKTESIAFFCECGLNACFTTIWKTKTEFDVAVEARESWILADGHRAAAPFPEELPSPGSCRATEPGPAIVYRTEMSSSSHERDDS